MKYQLYKDGFGFAVYEPNDGSVWHTHKYPEATEASLSDWSEVLGLDLVNYHQILCAGDAPGATKENNECQDQTTAQRGADSCAAPLLGAVEHTSRGFELIEFVDHYGEKCSLQASSLAEYEKPGTSAVWLGCEEAKKHPATGETLSPRMHLNREQVAALIAHLQSWLDDDTFAVVTPNAPRELPERE